MHGFAAPFLISIPNGLEGLAGSVAAIGVGNVGGVTNIPSFLLDVLDLNEHLSKLRGTVTQFADLATAVGVSQEAYEVVAVLNFEVTETTEDHLKEIIVDKR